MILGKEKRDSQSVAESLSAETVNKVLDEGWESIGSTIAPSGQQFNSYIKLMPYRVKGLCSSDLYRLRLFDIVRGLFSNLESGRKTPLYAT